MSNYPGEIILAASLLAASLGPKLWLQHRSAQIDAERLDRDIVERLATAKFHSQIDRSQPVAAILAWRRDCQLTIWNGDRARELGVVFKLATARYGPVLIGYRATWKPGPAPARSILERFAQDGAARIGIHVGRPAVLALAQSGACRDVRAVLDGLIVHSSAASVRGPKD